MAYFDDLLESLKENVEGAVPQGGVWPTNRPISQDEVLNLTPDEKSEGLKLYWDRVNKAKKMGSQDVNALKSIGRMEFNGAPAQPVPTPPEKVVPGVLPRMSASDAKSKQSSFSYEPPDFGSSKDDGFRNFVLKKSTPLAAEIPGLGAGFFAAEQPEQLRADTWEEKSQDPRNPSPVEEEGHQAKTTLPAHAVADTSGRGPMGSHMERTQRERDLSEMMRLAERIPGAPEPYGEVDYSSDTYGDQFRNEGSAKAATESVASKSGDSEKAAAAIGPVNQAEGSANTNVGSARKAAADVTSGSSTIAPENTGHEVANGTVYDETDFSPGAKVQRSLLSGLYGGPIGSEQFQAPDAFKQFVMGGAGNQMFDDMTSESNRRASESEKLRREESEDPFKKWIKDQGLSGGIRSIGQGARSEKYMDELNQLIYAMGGRQFHPSNEPLQIAAQQQNAQAERENSMRRWALENQIQERRRGEDKKFQQDQRDFDQYEKLLDNHRALQFQRSTNAQKASEARAQAATAEKELMLKGTFSKETIAAITKPLRSQAAALDAENDRIAQQMQVNQERIDAFKNQKSRSAQNAWIPVGSTPNVPEIKNKGLFGGDTTITQKPSTGAATSSAGGTSGGEVVDKVDDDWAKKNTFTLDVPGKPLTFVLDPQLVGSPGEAVKRRVEKDTFNQAFHAIDSYEKALDKFQSGNGSKSIKEIREEVSAINALIPNLTSKLINAEGLSGTQGNLEGAEHALNAASKRFYRAAGTTRIPGADAISTYLQGDTELNVSMAELRAALKAYKEAISQSAEIYAHSYSKDGVVTEGRQAPKSETRGAPSQKKPQAGKKSYKNLIGDPVDVSGWPQEKIDDFLKRGLLK